jgi:hypothetical protein
MRAGLLSVEARDLPPPLEKNGRHRFFLAIARCISLGYATFV